MKPYQDIFDQITHDERYQNNLDWGRPRRGHPEGTVRAHIDELERNLRNLRCRLMDEERWKLRILIHTHDTFKADAKRGVAICHPESHASLARAFLAEFCGDASLLACVQYHDEPFALWRKSELQHRPDNKRLSQLFQNISDWNLFLAFQIVDGCTAGKNREPLRWLFARIDGRVESFVTLDDLL